MWSALVEERCGTYFGDSRVFYLSNCLWDRMQAQSIRSYAEYYQFVTRFDSERQEWNSLLERLVNRETSFFRHQPSYQGLQMEVLPRLIEERQRQGVSQLTFWSAGCSTGEEPYSMAMTGLEAVNGMFFGGPSLAIAVTGSDISEIALERARRARYGARSAAGVSAPVRKRYMTLVEAERDVYYDVNPFVKAMVEFRRFNLVAIETYGAPGMDVIFCQNVLIYFKDALKVKIVENLASMLNPGGYLFLAPGEIVGRTFAGLERVRVDSCTVFRRVS